MIYCIERIYLPENAPQQAKFASMELQYYFSMITGKPFSIGDEKENAVVLTQTESDLLGEDGFRIIPQNRHIEIQGGKRGILYGAYELLELLGCRFFTPQCEKVPTASEISINLEKEIFQKPILEYREHNYIDLCEHPRFAVKCRMNGSHHKIPERLGGNLTYAWYVHTVERLVPPKLYAQTHPEYYALDENGQRNTSRAVCQLCLTNPDVLEISIENVRRALIENPQAKIISISQNDTGKGACHCDACKRIEEEEGSAAGPILRFVNAIAERLEPEFPSVIFDTLAYVYTRTACKITRPRKNVCVRLCSIEACFSHSFESCDDTTRHRKLPDGTKHSFLQDLEEWGRICERMYIWDYVTCFAHYPAPHPNWRALQPNMRAFIKNNVKGILEQANYSKGGGSDLNEMRAYVISKLLWDAETDVERHITEFSDYYYGAAGKYIREYINILCDKAEKDNIHVGFNDNLQSPLFSEEMLDIYDSVLYKAETAVYDQPLYRLRVQKAKLSLRWVRLKRKAMLQNQIDREEVNRFFLDWQSHGLTRIDEWVDTTFTLRAFVDNKWRGVAYLNHWTDERLEILF